MSQIKAMSEDRQVSMLAEELKGSEIIKLAAEIKAKIAAGEEIFNYTIGDFNPEIFPIPSKLKNLIQEAYDSGITNYPQANGISELREAVSHYIKINQGLEYSPDNILISGGARPLIYAAYQAILDPSEDALFPVPSWNNNHYTTLSRGNQVAIETTAGNNFMPTAEDLIGKLESAGILALCSPLNPTGTVFSEESLKEISEAVVAENKRREGVRKPLYVIYDQIYWQLCHGTNVHFDPVSLVPEMKDYTIFIDGISKAFASTGVRVGWAMGPSHIVNKMKAILGHIGAWAPKPEQVGSAKFLSSQSDSQSYLKGFKSEILERLRGFYYLFKELKEEGYPVDVITPQAAIYLTVKIDLVGLRSQNGTEIKTVKDTTQYILNNSGLALVPFSAFGASENSNWYRLSVGTSKLEDVSVVGSRMREALKKLNID